MEGILNKENGNWIVNYDEQFKTKQTVRSVPISKEEIKLLHDDLIGKKVEFKLSYICDFDFTSRCTLGRCNCDEVAENLRIII